MGQKKKKVPLGDYDSCWQVKRTPNAESDSLPTLFWRSTSFFGAVQPAHISRADFKDDNVERCLVKDTKKKNLQSQTATTGRVKYPIFAILCLLVTMSAEDAEPRPLCEGSGSDYC